MKTNTLKISTFLACLLAGTLNAQDLQTISISATKIITPTKQADETLYTGSEVTKHGIEMQGVKASSNVYDAISNLSGVNVESVDATGLSVEQSKVRIRGVTSSFSAMTIDGIPNYGLGPIGGRSYIYDMQNIDSISVYKGGVPADIGTGVGSRGGAIALRPKYSDKEFSSNFEQSVGSDSFTKTYLRVESGELNKSGTRLSAAFSYAKADKFRGEGEVGGRKNLNLSLVHPFSKSLELKLWYNKSTHKQHSYRALSYAEIQTNYDLDFTQDPNSKLYFDHNKGEYENDDLYADLSYAVDRINTISIKPYYSKEDSYTYFAQMASPSPTLVQKRPRDIERMGSVSEFKTKLYDINLLLGHHYERVDANVVTENYNASSTGLDYVGLGGIAADGVSNINSPYIKLSSVYDRFKWQLGLKYFVFKDSDVDDPKDPDANRKGRDYKLWLPTFGLSYDLFNSDTKLELYTNYGKNFVRPYSYAPLVNYYKKNKAEFSAIGISAQELFDGYTTEQSDNVDLGFRYISDKIEISSNIFVAKHKNLLVAIVNPLDTSLTYQQNIAKATSYGLEAEMNFYFSDDLSAFLNPTYNNFTYDHNIMGMDTDSNQVVDSPEFLLKSGIIYKVADFEIIPIASYMGSRYGDALNNEKIDSVWLANLLVRYEKKNFYKSSDLLLTLESNNIFNKEYISVINASDDSLQSSSYYQGAPRNIMFSMGMNF